MSNGEIADEAVAEILILLETIEEKLCIVGVEEKIYIHSINEDEMGVEELMIAFLPDISNRLKAVLKTLESKAFFFEPTCPM